MSDEKPKVTFRQARAFVDALCGYEEPSNPQSRPKSPGALTHLEALLGKSRRATPISVDHVDQDDPEASMLAKYLVDIGQVLLMQFELRRKAREEARVKMTFPETVPGDE